MKLKLTQVMMKHLPHAEGWEVYRLLTSVHPELDDRAAIDIITPSNMGNIVPVLLSSQAFEADRKV
ncbi:hypothetical protein [Pectobacterium brasiliense]